MTFVEACQRIPKPGVGRGCHQYLLTVANIGVREGLKEQELVLAILEAIPQGTRKISHKEISDTVRKAIHDRNGKTFHGAAHGVSLSSFRKTNERMMERFLHPSGIAPTDFVRNSPIPFDPTDHNQQLIEVLHHMYDPTDLLFIGEHRSNGEDRIFSASDWMATAQKYKAKDFPNFLIWNPLTGLPARCKGSDKMSVRCDNAVAEYKYAVAEFDELPINTQLRFWAGCRLPVVALVFSGKKSIHAILKVPTNVHTQKDWDIAIRAALYKRWLIPLGVDPACSNPSRLSRCPGALREDTEMHQKLLYLNPAGTPIYIEPAEQRDPIDTVEWDNLQAGDYEDEGVDIDTE